MFRSFTGVNGLSFETVRWLGVVAKFIRRARDGKVLEIYGDGHQTRDYIFTEDLVRAIRLAATTSDVGGELFQIATNSETSVNERVDALVPVLREAGIDDVEVTNTEPRVGDVRRNYSDTSRPIPCSGGRRRLI